MKTYLITIEDEDCLEYTFGAVATKLNAVYVVEDIPARFWGLGAIQVGDVVYATPSTSGGLTYIKTLRRAVWYHSCKCGYSRVGYLNTPSHACKGCGSETEYKVEMRNIDGRNFD